MDRSDIVYQTCVEILRRELVCAMGCTEPIALAYCAATARSVLGAVPDRITVEASGNIIKNVKSVVVPHTGGRRGIAAAAAIGVLGGDESAGLEVISNVKSEVIEGLGPYLEHTPIEIKSLESTQLLDMIVTVYKGDSCAKVRIANEHTHIVSVERDGVVLRNSDVNTPKKDEAVPDYNLLTVENIYDFACTCDLEDVRPILERQITLNTAIAEEGLRHDYGANIGKVLLTTGDNLRTRAKAFAAAGSDARMNGSEMPVVICSGSGNQGLMLRQRQPGPDHVPACHRLCQGPERRHGEALSSAAYLQSHHPALQDEHRQTLGLLRRGQCRRGRGRGDCVSARWG